MAHRAGPKILLSSSTVFVRSDAGATLAAAMEPSLVQ